MSQWPCTQFEMLAILIYLVISPGVLFTKGCKCSRTHDHSYDRTVSPWKLFTKYVAHTNVLNLVVNLRHTCSCRTPIANLKNLTDNQQLRIVL